MKEGKIPKGSKVWFSNEEQIAGHITFPGRKGTDIVVFPGGIVTSCKIDPTTGELETIKDEELVKEARAIVDAHRDKFNLCGMKEGHFPVRFNRIEVRNALDQCRASIRIEKQDLVISVIQPLGTEKVIKVPIEP
jgi:hypothetical protein